MVIGWPSQHGIVITFWGPGILYPQSSQSRGSVSHYHHRMTHCYRHNATFPSSSWSNLLSEQEQILTHNVYVNLNSSRRANKRTELTIYSQIRGTCNFTLARPGGSGLGRAMAGPVRRVSGRQSVTESRERNMSERRRIKYNQFPINPP